MLVKKPDMATAAGSVALSHVSAAIVAWQAQEIAVNSRTSCKKLHILQHLLPDRYFQQRTPDA